MTPDEMIAVIQAHKDGKKIEARKKGDNEWYSSGQIIWDFAHYDYRIKPEPHYRPFKSAEEVMEAIKEHGNWVKYTGKEDVHDRNTYFSITMVTNKDVYIGWHEALEFMSTHYTFVDGTPFGVEEE